MFLERNKYDGPERLGPDGSWELTRMKWVAQFRLWKMSRSEDALVIETGHSKYQRTVGR